MYKHSGSHVVKNCVSSILKFWGQLGKNSGGKICNNSGGEICNNSASEIGKKPGDNSGGQGYKIFEDQVGRICEGQKFKNLHLGTIVTKWTNLQFWWGGG